MRLFVILGIGGIFRTASKAQEAQSHIELREEKGAKAVCGE
jgi:hypothetical protein